MKRIVAKMNVNIFNINIIIMSLLLFGSCSSTEHNRTKRMNNGIDALLGEFKYVVAIAALNTAVATGGIIDKYHILTAAHTFIQDKTNIFKTYSYKIIAGTNDVSLAEPPRIVVDVARVYIPNGYDPLDADGYSDIAVVRLRTPLDLTQSDRLQAMTLPSVNYSSMDNNEYKNQKATVAGFGLVVRNSELCESTRLFKLHVKVMDYVDCNRALQHQSARFLCAKVFNPYHNFASGVCHGDSGAPLVNENGVTIAIVQSGYTENQRHEPAVYTKITPYLEFIRNALAGRIVDMRVGVYTR